MGLLGRAPFDCRPDSRLLTLEHRFDSAVRPVPHPSGEPQGERALLRVRSEEDPLDKAFEERMSADLHASEMALPCDEICARDGDGWTRSQAERQYEDIYTHMPIL